MNANSFLATGMQRPDDPLSHLEFSRAGGSWIVDARGKRYLDCVSAYSATNLGHAHPALVQVLRDTDEQLGQVVGLPTTVRGLLAERLAQLSPLTLPTKIWLASTGSRAVEIAMKLSIANRPGQIVGFQPSFHGRSLGTAPYTDTLRLPVLEQSDPVRLPYADCGRCPVGRTPGNCSAECSDAGLEWIESQAASISAVLVEPALGARGYEFPPAVFFHRLRQVTSRHDILMIVDEVQMGLGRMGRLFACQQIGLEPDFIVLGKSLGGGLMPISAVLGPAAWMDRLPVGIESETFAASPLACRLALASLEVLTAPGSESRWVDIGIRLQRAGKSIMLGLREMFSVESRVESCGPNLAIEIDPRGERSNPEAGLAFEFGQKLAGRWTAAARDLGLLVHHSGRHGNRVVVIPPLTISDLEIEDAMVRLSGALTSCYRSSR